MDFKLKLIGTMPSQPEHFFLKSIDLNSTQIKIETKLILVDPNMNQLNINQLKTELNDLFAKCI